jgi:transposase-like protein
MFESKYSFNEKQAIISEFEKRKCTSSKFAKHYAITPATIYKWKRNLSSKSKFISLELDYDNQKLSKISSCLTLSRKDLSIKFDKGCHLSELRAVFELINATKY